MTSIEDHEDRITKVERRIENSKLVNRSVHFFYFYLLLQIIIIQVYAARTSIIHNLSEYSVGIVIMLVLIYTFLNSAVGKYVVEYSVHILISEPEEESHNNKETYIGNFFTYLIIGLSILAFVLLSYGVKTGLVSLRYDELNILSVLTMLSFMIVWFLFSNSVLRIIIPILELIIEFLEIKIKFIRAIKRKIDSVFDHWFINGTMKMILTFGISTGFFFWSI